MLAVAAESSSSSLAFLAVGSIVTFVHCSTGSATSSRRPPSAGDLTPILDRGAGWLGFLRHDDAVGPASSCCCRASSTSRWSRTATRRTPRRAAWMFPLYLVLINIFVIPLARRRRPARCPPGVDQDMTVLALPLHARPEHRGAVRLHRRPLGGHRHGDRGMRGARHHGLQRPRDAAGAAPAGDCRGRRARRGDMGGLILGIRRVAILARAAARPMSTTGNMGEAALAVHRPHLLRGHRADRAGLLRRAVLAARQGAGRDGRPRRGHRGLGLHAADPQHRRTDWRRSAARLGIDWRRARQRWARRPASASACRDHPRRAVEPRRSTRLSMSPSRCARPATPIERLQASAFVSPDMPAMAQTFRLWRSSRHRRGTARDRRALSRRGADRRAPSRPSRAAAASSWSRSREADIHLLRFAEHLLASAIGAASSRLVLSLLLRRRNVDQEGCAEAARRCLRRHPVQPRPAAARARPCPPGHHRVRQGPAPDVLEPRVPGPLRTARRTRPRRRRARRDRPLQRRARRLWRRRAGRIRRRAARKLRRTISSRCACACTPPATVIEIRSAHMPDGGIVTTYTDITGRGRGGGGAGARQRDAGAPRPRAHRGADAAQRGARRGQGARPRRPTSPRRASWRPPATTSCSRSTPRASTRPRWSSATRRRATATPRAATSTPRWRRSRRSSPRCSTSRGSTPGAMKAGDHELPHRGHPEPAQARVRARGAARRGWSSPSCRAR